MYYHSYITARKMNKGEKKKCYETLKVYYFRLPVSWRPHLVSCSFPALSLADTTCIFELMSDMTSLCLLLHAGQVCVHVAAILGTKSYPHAIERNETPESA